MIDIIPAIDLLNGRCVRLVQGDFARQTIYEDDPATVALRFEDAGLSRLHLVDLDGARTGSITQLKVLERIASKTALRIDFSGGIKTAEEIRMVLDAGASWVSIGSMAVKEPQRCAEWLTTFAGKIMLGADVRANGLIAIHGWQQATERNVFDLVQQYYDLGLQQVFCTDISRDGMLQGPAVSLYRQMIQRFPRLDVIASGGVSTLEDINALEAAGCKGVITGKAIYEGKISLAALSSYTSKND